MKANLYTTTCRIREGRKNRETNEKDIEEERREELEHLYTHLHVDLQSRS
jgi:hypothetical protein